MSWRKKSKSAGGSGPPRGAPPAVRRVPADGCPARWTRRRCSEFFVESGRVETIEKMLTGCMEREIPYTLLGAGTNLLIADKGIEGLVIRVVNRDHRIEGTRVTAGAGLKMMRLARIVADAGLRSFEFAIGVPGTVGGAVYQNAGCWGKETAARIGRDGQRRDQTGPGGWQRRQPSGPRAADRSGRRRRMTQPAS